MKQQHNIFSRWLFSHVRAFCAAIGTMTRSPLANLITFGVIGIAISLPLGLFVLLQNLQNLNTQWSTTAPTISLYIKPAASNTQINHLKKQLQNNPKIAGVTYISPEEGLKTFERVTPLAGVLKLFHKNPLPSVMVVLPTLSNQNPLAIKQLFFTLKQFHLVDVGQLDMDWVKKLYYAIAIGNKMAGALSLLFGFGVLLIIGNTLRLSTLSHAKEIQVLKLIGATPGFIRRPLLYRGILYGFFGGLLAWLLTNLFIWQLQKPVSQLAQTYSSSFQLQLLSFTEGWFVLLTSAALGFIGTWLMITPQLNRAETPD